MKSIALLSLIALTSLIIPAQAADSVTFGTNWLAQAEQGGFYQAVADGTFLDYGLDVKILPGGPQINNRLLLVSGKIDFYMDANLISLLTSAEQNIPTLGVAAIFQKAPIIFMSHPGVGLDRFEDLPHATAFIGKENLATDYQWLKLVHGFKDENVKPYTFNSAPFIADQNAIQQGYLTSEPYQIELKAGFKPNVFLLADHGFDSYSTIIETRRDMIEQSPDLVQRFINASIIGWYHYLYGDNRAANAVIKKITFANNAVILNPVTNDPQYNPIILRRDFSVFGKVIEVIKVERSEDYEIVPV